MIPAFSLERTQELLFEINDLVEAGRIPKVPIFLDSPLAIKATSVYRKYENYFNKEAHARIKSGDDLFKFPGLKLTLTTEESKDINNVPAPKVVIAGSGMSNGGRIIHHERRYLPDVKSTLLLVGYQAAGSMGRMLQDGAKEVTILGEKVPVRARVETLQGYSAHPDRDALLRFVEKGKDRLQKVFAIQGEPASCLFLVQRVRDYLGIEASAPRYGESSEL
ncbi:MAG: RNA-metabolising metallo-beta-lactamase [Candidatus Giovannonibacteria bacterium GW2011_GWA2_53_7]|uniref:RNA-metabolising metallo-beta-lactamase n=1 Tax=Candidatus Giovannonibacteria bacterium GW2011_GWA2_53_7 TaxID=1618650 RepID=A0A0G2AMW2_9BACT|nr:MAG: RNA-metabolising metallo-beta-lactamase [Candidatus Giovannonibacteria bacterium GW2011_GWA2_53_7]